MTIDEPAWWDEWVEYTGNMPETVRLKAGAPHKVQEEFEALMADINNGEFN